LGLWSGIRVHGEWLMRCVSCSYVWESGRVGNLTCPRAQCVHNPTTWFNPSRNSHCFTEMLKCGTKLHFLDSFVSWIDWVPNPDLLHGCHGRSLDRISGRNGSFRGTKWYVATIDFAAPRPFHVRFVALNFGSGDKCFLKDVYLKFLVMTWRGLSCNAHWHWGTNRELPRLQSK